LVCLVKTFNCLNNVFAGLQKSKVNKDTEVVGRFPYWSLC